MRLSNGEVLLAWPLAQHIITQGWFYNDGSLHQAVDLRTQIDNIYIRPVYAAEDGTVDQTQDWDGHTRTGMQSYGNMVRIKHAPYKGSVLQTRYAHLSSYCVKYGQQVKEGEIIGYSGVTGNVFGAHLHFEVILGGKRTNPLVWLDDDFTTASKNVYTYGPGEHAVERPAAAGVTTSTTTNGLQIITAKGLTNQQAWSVYMLATQLQLVTMRLYAADFADADCTHQNIEVGPVSGGDAKQIMDKLTAVGATGTAEAA